MRASMRRLQAGSAGAGARRRPFLSPPPPAAPAVHLLPPALPLPCSHKDYKPVCGALVLKEKHWDRKERRCLYTEAFPNK